VRMKTGLSAVRDELQAVVRGENEESSLVVSWCAYYGDGFGHQQLVGAMGVQVDARQERGLRGVGLNVQKESNYIIINGLWWTYVYPSDRDQVVLVLEVEDFFFVHGGARVGGAFLFWEDHVGYDQFVLF
jgi:hypothetical protein